MIKFPFSKKEERDLKRNAIALDIGTEVLKAVFFSTSDDGVVTHKVSRIQQQQNAMNKGIITNLNTVLENCNLALREITTELPEESRPTDIVLGIAGEYVQGVSIVVNYEREVNYDREVNEKEQEKIIAKVQQQILHNGKEDLALRTGLTQEDIEILQMTITGMEIGGMPVKTLVGFKGRSVKLFFYASFAPKTYTSALRNISKTLNLNLIGIVAQPFSVARAFMGARNKDFSGIFIDIGGGTTDIAVVEQGNVTDTQMFAFGGRVFTKEIARSLNLDFRHSESRKIKYAQGELGKTVSADMKKIVYPVAKLWMKTLKAAFEMNKDITMFPNKIFLCGGGSLLPEMKEVMMEFPWSKLLPFATVPKIALIKPSDLENISDESGDLNHIYDVTPTALALFGWDKLKNPKNYDLQ